MSEENRPDGEERSHAPTQHRLQKSREEGDVPYSTEITTAATYAAFFAALVTAGGWSIAKIMGELSGFLRRPEDAGAALVSPFAASFLGHIALDIGAALAPIFGALMIAALASIFAQRAFTFAPSKVAPKFERLSIFKNAKNKYGAQGLFEFAKSFVKLSAILIIVLFAFKDRFLELPNLSGLPAEAFAQVAAQNAVFFAGLITAAALAIAAADFPWRLFQHQKRLMMTTEELKKEHKETEGDPAMKGARRERGSRIARNRMLADVPKASVVIVNPSHYAVALKWDRDKGGAPVCVAKGVDEIAARIREAASASGVPITRDPPTARSIYALVEIGHEIKREHYAAVAAAIHYADEIQRKAKLGIGQ